MNEVEDELGLPSLEDDAPQGRSGRRRGDSFKPLAPSSCPQVPGSIGCSTSRASALRRQAKSIKKPASCLDARMAGHTARIMRMIAATATIEFVSTGTGPRALLLEGI